MSQRQTILTIVLQLVQGTQGMTGFDSAFASLPGPTAFFVLPPCNKTCRWATQEPGVMGATYDSVHWDPPANEAYKWRYPRPEPPSTLRIYEAHVGMSGEEPGVASYSFFRDNVLPRIKNNGYTAVQLMAIQVRAACAFLFQV
ncbi:hypothetical protein DUNSADRAFT_6535 [Dunaliella salina]|uniref:Uncharacterized protein n=1 Tax=Dunaliella salina TaxID=3046 RepID=A0ABQ7FTS5_DUNSA|nr:hypothetical protein DUNSADRAFT_6535 [Dunaliella salina]|eukprot:KAF5825839.1 hypothetical protein DUNSADRAFT_6535 [Dunaliella salina]